MNPAAKFFLTLSIPPFLLSYFHFRKRDITLKSVTAAEVIAKK